MAKMYCIQASITRTKDGWKSSVQLPTFYLCPDVQGIINESHACDIAKHTIEQVIENDRTVDNIYCSATLVDIH